MAPEDIANRFEFHPAATPERQAAHECVRTLCHTPGRRTERGAA